MLKSNTTQITDPQQIQLNNNNAHSTNNTKQSLLQFDNISQLLRQKITMDPLQRYLNK